VLVWYLQEFPTGPEEEEEEEDLFKANAVN
jgi:hypothetical protein